ncbi:hypothetical protein JS532_04370 [Bifidobacterium callimiconis]|uniref:sensor histidine kinase n=1 Tax=Bifidobacterium callimiconis TaxID=2306973 RepID=UPI001BDCE71B|nr:hypothetical protein [Bifidobacterium callimiconis]MBT1176805.1 hypothetical protein [Bifidobacterium callimiconis]
MNTLANRLHHWYHTHPWRILITVAAFIVTLIEFALMPIPHGPIADGLVPFLLICYAYAVASMAWHPRVGGILTAVLYILIAQLRNWCSIDLGILPFIPGVMLALALMVYEYTPTLRSRVQEWRDEGILHVLFWTLGLIYPVALAIYVLVSTFGYYMHGWMDLSAGAWMSSIGIASQMAIAPLVAYALLCRNRAQRAIEEASRLRDREREFKARERDLALAGNIHDAVTNELSSIALVAGRKARSTDLPNGERETYDGLYRQSLHALDELHRVIDMLRVPAVGDSSDTAGHASTSATVDGGACNADDGPAMIRATLDGIDRQLHRVGFDGTGMLSIDESAPKALSPVVADAIRSLLREICANIMRHADPTQPYMIAVRIGEHTITVTETNSCAADESWRGRSGGVGLASQRSRIESLGGVVRTTRQDDSWIIHVELPIE